MTLLCRTNRVLARAISRQLRLVSVIALSLLCANHAIAQSQSETPATAKPEWCDCERLDAAQNEEERTGLLDEMKENQSICWQKLGVSPEQSRKGQGARLDACTCDCLYEGAEPTEGPWGDHKKPARQGQGQQQGKQENH